MKTLIIYREGFTDASAAARPMEQESFIKLLNLQVKFMRDNRCKSCTKAKLWIKHQSHN
jgi:hypothetical protein